MPTCSRVPATLPKRVAWRAPTHGRRIACWCSARSSPSGQRSNSLGYSHAMEARAKQRLTGAIILVALFVLLVPELLTGPREAHPATETPSDEGLRRYTIDLDARNAPNAPTSPATDQPAV